MELPLRNRRLGLIKLIKTLFSVLWAALREFVWTDLRNGLIDLHSLSRPLRAIVWLGFALTAGALLLLTQTPALRHTFPLFTSVSSVLGRGLHIPIVLFPLTLFLLSLAWAYLLTGACQSHWLIRWSVMLVFLFSAADWFLPLLSSDLWAVVIAILLLVSMLLSFVLPRSKRLRLYTYFVFYLFCVGGIFAITQFRLIAQGQSSGLSLIESLVESNIRSLATIALPLLFLVGLDIAYFTVHASTWVSQAATALIPNALVLLATGALLVWNLWQGFTRLLNQYSLLGLTSFAALLGANLALVLLLWISWSLLTRLPTRSHIIGMKEFAVSTASMSVVFVMAYLLPLLAANLLDELAQFIAYLAVQLQSGFFGTYPAFVTWATGFSSAARTISLGANVTLFLESWGEVIAFLLAFFLAQRNYLASALYVAAVGLQYLWLSALLPGGWLQFLGSPSLSTVDLIFMLVVTIVALSWARRGQLTTLRLQQILILTLILTLLRQTDLIAAPLAPLFSLAGAGALALGLGWDILTSGNWANLDTDWLPHTSRVFLYLGYVLLTVTVVIWVITAHDFDFTDRFTGEYALDGLVIFGYPYLFALIYVVLTGGAQEPTLEDSLQ